MSHSVLEPQVPVVTKLVSVDGRLYPLESAHLRSRAEGGIAFTTLVQTFANPYDEPLEVVYTMPLPGDGAVTSYTVRIGERTIRGEIQPREQASAAYRQAVFEGKIAGLLEQQRPDTFEQKLGNVPPRTQVDVSIDILHPLAFLTPSANASLDAAGEISIQAYRRTQPQWEYRFPTVVGVRYLGEPGRVHDPHELSPKRGGAGDIPAKVQLSLAIADHAASQAWSDSHRIDFGPNGEVTFADGQSLDRDVVVRWPAAQEQVGVGLVEGSGLEGDDGRYALVTLLPPASPSATYRRDVTVLLDASGSMTGLPLELAKVVVGDLLRSLRAGDRFELLAFSNTVTRLTRGFVGMSESSLSAALRSLGAVQADGGTEMANALVEAMKATGEESQHQVVLVTDGQIGFEAEVVGRVAAQQNVRLHVVGVGSVPNRALTQQAAAAGRGLELLASTHGEANAAARRLVNGTAGPVLTQVTVSGTAIAGAAPVQLRDVFAGQPLLFTLELSREAGTLEIGGALAGSGHRWVHPISVPAAGASDALVRTPLPLGALHGREVVMRLEREHASLGYRAHASRHLCDASALDRRIEQAAMRHRVVSRRTSLVAIGDEPAVDPLAPRRRQRLAVEVPSGVSAAGVGLEWVDAVFSAEPRYGNIMSMDSPEVAAAPRSTSLSSILRSVQERILPTGPALPQSADLPVAEARWLAADRLLLELELPVDHLPPPRKPIFLTWQDTDGYAVVVGVEFLAAESSRLDEARAGTIVRLAFRVLAGEIPPDGQLATVEWSARMRTSTFKRPRVSVTLRFLVPSREVRAPSSPEAGA